MAPTEQNGDPFDPESLEPTASFNITFEIFILLLILPVIYLETRNKKRNQSQIAQQTKRLMIAVLLSNCVHQITWIVMMTTCIHCQATAMSMVHTRTILRGINLIFLIHRAKLCQGYKPILSERWFTRTLPAIVAIWHVGLLTFYTLTMMEKEQVCVWYVDIDALEMCVNLDVKFRSSFQSFYDWLFKNAEHQHWTTDDMDLDRIGVYVLVAWDLVVTLFLMILFIVPLYRVYNTDTKIWDENRRKHKEQLQSLQIWSAILAFINQMTSTFFWLFVFGRSPMIVWLVYIGSFYIPINVWSSWLMVTRNRQYTKRVCPCCNLQENEEEVAESSAITDVSIIARNDEDSVLKEDSQRLEVWRETLAAVRDTGQLNLNRVKTIEKTQKDWRTQRSSIMNRRKFVHDSDSDSNSGSASSANSEITL